MRIGISGTFWPAFTTGSGQHIRGLLPALVAANRDHDLILYIPRFALPDPSRAQDTPTLTKIVKTPFDHRNRDLAKLWFEQIALPRACHRDNIQLLHVPYLGAPLVHSFPVITTVHDLIPLIMPEYRSSLAVRAYMGLATWAARHSQFIIAVSQSAANDIQQLLRIPETRFRVIYNAVSGFFQPISKPEYDPVARRLSLPKRYLLYLGGFDRRKNVPELLQAFRNIRQQIPTTLLVIAGRLPVHDTAFTPDPRRLVNELGLVESVLFLDEVTDEDKPAIYCGALALVFPSSYEGFGLPVLEALTCGTPTILSANSSLREVGGEGALYVPTGDITALSQAMLRLCQEPDFRQQLAQAGSAQAQRFSWADSAKQTLAVYQRVLEKSGARKR
jgi:glycosyltransferase involved in cell wall biosynthesis